MSINPCIYIYGGVTGFNFQLKIVFHSLMIIFVLANNVDLRSAFIFANSAGPNEMLHNSSGSSLFAKVPVCRYPE